MTSILLYGASGRAGTQIRAEAARRGLHVTPAPRTSAPASPAAVTTADPAADVAIRAVYGPDYDAVYVAGTHRLLADLERAGIPRLLVVGLASVLPGPDGTPMFRSPDFPEEWRPFSEARAAELDILRAYEGPVDWALCVPPMTLVADESAGYTYAQLAKALLDEATTPKHHREHYTLEP
ncbi:hypothetical protein KZZ52_47825 [Dactylosporangium sp. AC04546]|uniref:NAD(P)-dependent oxidoreductase n=1 Tax=Dactylosporangium sp. AC04546 TaxID=2862460 RepID=UPI001EE0464C|nr:hypothetical protein [Dactylosporangium sp. AC04546]WVK81615.1 hypothetical protein KZZ52_47825 [Dactylosporangium sp. AC04546]